MTETVVVGLMTYVVDSPLAAKLLEEAQSVDKEGRFDLSNFYKALANGVENKRISSDHVQMAVEGYDRESHPLDYLIGFAESENLPAFKRGVSIQKERFDLVFPQYSKE